MTVASWFFVVALAGALYFLAGYPLLLRLVPFRKRPILKDLHYTPSVSVLMAVHNGESFLEAKLRNLLELDYPRDLVEYLVISDGSTDRTDAIAKRFEAAGIQLVRVPRGGKAAAVNAGLARATGEILLFCDVRQRIQPDALRHLVANFADATVGAVTGELQILAPEGTGGEQESLGIYWRYELWARRIQSDIWSLFNVTGCLYAMRRCLVRSIPANTLADDIAFPMMAYWKGYRTVADPLAVAFDYPTQAGGEFRRRMRTLSGAWQVWMRQPKLLLTPHRMWIHFVSHKFGRLILPWLLLTAFVASIFLPSSAGKNLILLVEVSVGLAGLCDPWLPPRFPGKRLTSLVATFLTMNAAAFLSLQILFVPAHAMWSRPTEVDRAATGRLDG